MKRRWLLISCLSIAACAKGTLPSEQQKPDSAPRPDAPAVDARLPVDAAMVDARVVDANQACTRMPINVLVNGNFDGTPLGQGWTQMPTDIVAAYPMGLAQATPPNLAWLGGRPSATDTLYAQLTIPDTTSFITVRGKRWVGSADTGTVVHDTLALTLRDTANVQLAMLANFSNTDRGTAFVPFELTAPMAFAGQTVRLHFQVATDATLNTNFFFDDLEFIANACP